MKAIRVVRKNMFFYDKEKINVYMNQILDSALERHPIACFVAILIGGPIMLLTAVTVATLVVMLPISAICGWI